MKAGVSAYRILLAITFVACTSVSTEAQSAGRPPNQPMTNSDKTSFTEVGTISGRVTLPSGAMINKRVMIRLGTVGNPGVISYTDSKGEFTFRNLREGIYSLEVVGDSSLYEPVKEEVRLIRGGRVFLSVSLKERNGGAGAGAGGMVSAAEEDQNVPTPAKKEFEKATKLAGEGKITEAVTHLEKAIAIFPDYLMARNNLGAQYLKLDRTDNAIEQFKAAVQINPKSYNPRLNLGLILINQNKFSEAITFLSELESIDRSKPAGHFYYGFALLKSEKFEEAEQQFRRAIEFGGDDYVVSHFYLAHVYIQKRDRDKAIEELKTFLKKAPTNQYAAQVRLLLEQLEGAK